VLTSIGRCLVTISAIFCVGMASGYSAFQSPSFALAMQPWARKAAEGGVAAVPRDPRLPAPPTAATPTPPPQSTTAQTGWVVTLSEQLPVDPDSLSPRRVSGFPMGSPPLPRQTHEHGCGSGPTAAPHLSDWHAAARVAGGGPVSPATLGLGSTLELTHDQPQAVPPHALWGEARSPAEASPAPAPVPVPWALRAQAVSAMDALTPGLGASPEAMVGRLPGPFPQQCHHVLGHTQCACTPSASPGPSPLQLFPGTPLGLLQEVYLRELGDAVAIAELAARGEHPGAVAATVAGPSGGLNPFPAPPTSAPTSLGASGSGSTITDNAPQQLADDELYEPPTYDSDSGSEKD
jgi:hypothetical protein